MASLDRETIIRRVNEALKNKSERLDLSGGWPLENSFYLPKEFAQLQYLIELNLNYNQLSSIPSEVFRFKNLEILHLSHNLIVNIPTKIFSLKKLRKLYLEYNYIQTLTPMIGQTISLEELYLDGNEIASLPSEISKLQELNILSVGNNKLSILPKGIGTLKKLTELNIESNLITKLPIDLQNLTNLQKFIVDHNPLPIPLEILTSKNPNAIFSAYFGKEKKNLNESKILFVGQGSVGKTSLVWRLTIDEFNPTQVKTEGITITRWHVDNKSPNENIHSKIRLNIWDFGGQEIMHATHQFFLTKRSLYLLVLDSRLTQEENRVEYWLKIIQSFGGESPVLIVGNKTDQHPLDIDRTGLKKKYPNIVGILETSAATGAGIEELKAAIAEQVNNLPHVRDLLPETWFTVKTQLEELGRKQNFITHDKYLELCTANEVNDETSQRTLIGFLHDLGVVLHFQDDPRLEALGILNPQWVTNGVYKILNSHALFQNKGVLTVAMLDEILNFPEYPASKRLFIVDMMRKFELCYDIEPDKTFLVPDLLPKDEPFTGEWDDALAFQYNYNVLPSSIITRFIVRMNMFIHETVWRTGVLLKSGGNTALVKADTEDRKVFIWVKGDEHKRRDFLAKIRGEFDVIHASIAKIEAREMVPVPGHPEAEPVAYDLFLQMENNGVDVYPVLSGGKMIVVNVREMLNGVESEQVRKTRDRGGNVVNFNIGGNVDGSTFIAGDENEVRQNPSARNRKKRGKS